VHHAVTFTIGKSSPAQQSWALAWRALQDEVLDRRSGIQEPVPGQRNTDGAARSLSSRRKQLKVSVDPATCSLSSKKHLT
jgi:hypothetical protein